MKKAFLLLATLLLLAPVAPAQVVPPPITPAEKAARDSFEARMTVVATRGDWRSVLAEGRAWQKSHPTDSNGWWVSGDGSYNLGDIDAAIRDYSRGYAMDGGGPPDPHFTNARRVRAHYPHLQLKPLQFVKGDVRDQQDLWRNKGAALIKAARYDDIEKITRDLQRSNATNAEGTPSLYWFFAGVCESGAKLSVRQSRVSAWKAARPNSALAQIAAIEFWTSAAWKVRGDGYADTITPKMSEGIAADVAHALTIIKALPPSAYNSPLTFDALLEWGRIASAPRPVLNDIFKAGTSKFPNYLPLYRTRAVLLLPRWFGEPGELEAFVTRRADALGGAKGDIFYARMIWSLVGYYGDMWQQTTFSYARFKRGMNALCKAQPDSVWAANTLMNFAQRHDDYAPVKAFLASPRGYLIDEQWWTKKGQVNLPGLRMEWLA